ncbi:cytochrome P450 [Streptomyces sp. TLI_146]|uniref:cytochrome P450 family protein n=1 Tax=Streptomyces sp. TLI_146 TaxID=1938858 RepID=UPI000C702943|nr:cytochrome P450 [Streptomyces sp. TLI_146]PKV88721.1 cytochrome P450 [Streptomyces sp. TLI_146]
MPLVDLRDHEDFTANPYPYYAKLRAEGPVHRVRTHETDEVWLIVGHDEARAALADARFSKDWRAIAEGDYEFTAVSANMLDSDPPQHTRLRKLVAREFTPRRIEALRPRVQKITDGLLDTMLAAPGRTADLVDSFAFPLPMTVICELLGVPDLDRETFRRLSNEAVAPTRNDGAAMLEMGAYLVQLIEDKRATAPADDLMSALIRTRHEDGDKLSPDELIGMAFLLLVAGHETTVNLISNGVRALLAHPEQLAALRADFDGLIDGAIEEMLRYDGPVETATYRFTKEAVECGGTVIPAGAPVLVALASAGRDPARYPDPDRFDIHRTPQSHLGFGHGIHYCLGAPLARMEGRIAIRTLLERAPDLELALDDGPLEWLPGMLIRGVRHLPVRW